MSSNIGFSYRKATQAINYFASKEHGSIDMLKVLKLIYFSDRYHLRKFSRTITNDEYYAMNFGPVASGTKDILEFSSFLDHEEKEYALKYLTLIPNSKVIKSIKETDLDELSSSEIEAMDYVWKLLGSKHPKELSNLTHKYPEWQKHSEQLKLKMATRIKMNLADFFDDVQPGLESFYSLQPEEKVAKIEYLSDVNNLESIWN
jgi:uncharacterized phage-associated protein